MCLTSSFLGVYVINFISVGGYTLYYRQKYVWYLQMPDCWKWENNLSLVKRHWTLLDPQLIIWMHIWPTSLEPFLFSGETKLNAHWYPYSYWTFIWWLHILLDMKTEIMGIGSSECFISHLRTDTYNQYYRLSKQPGSTDHCALIKPLILNIVLLNLWARTGTAPVLSRGPHIHGVPYLQLTSDWVMWSL